MKALADLSLVTCNSSSCTLSNEKINFHLKQLDNWCLEIENNATHLVKIYKFETYANALTFTNKVAELAVQANHHPKICIEWGLVTISWWTHTLNGLFLNDFIMAARCDEIYFN